MLKSYFKCGVYLFFLIIVQSRKVHETRNPLIKEFRIEKSIVK